LWYGLYRSGVHPTLAGVLLGLLAPNIAKFDSSVISDNGNQVTVIEWLEEKIHPWSTYLIVPIFAFANTGVEISTTSLKSAFNSPIAWAVFFGLVIGKPIGVVLSVYAARRVKVGSLPADSDFSGILGTGSAAGIGFTVAIFIAHLAFKDVQSQEIAIIGIIFASLISGLLSYAIFKIRKKSVN
jgi:NhaA family Na+:H+ antiporter